MNRSGSPWQLSRVTPANARDLMKSLLNQPARRKQFQWLKVQRGAKVGDARAAARSQGIAEPNGVARGHPEARGQIATGPLGTNPLLVDMPNDDAAPVNVGADAASQLHIVEKDYGHALLAL